ncbi:hypothetical protein JTB14_012542 [Gonioctena quinquepunctata]|nr:hypothetical protein JTB14_012542 [Gonioctena quinquepunctata]
MRVPNFKKKYREHVKKAKRCMYDNVIKNSGDSTKTAWKIVNEIQNKPGISRNHDTCLTANDFCEFSSIMIDNIIKQIPFTGVSGDELVNATVKDSVFLNPTNEKEITSVIKALKNSSSMDAYNMSSKIIKLIPEFLSTPLAHLVNTYSLDSIQRSTSMHPELKFKLFKNVHKFKGKKIFFADHLTKHRRVILKEAQTKLGVKNVWSFKGVIYTKHEGRNARINCEGDITKYSST